MKNIYNVIYNGYFVVNCDAFFEQAKRDIEELGIDTNSIDFVKYPHITNKYKPIAKETKAFEARELGTFNTAFVNGIGVLRGNKGEVLAIAYQVVGGKHITIATANGGKPVQNNEIDEWKHCMVCFYTIAGEFIDTGKITYIHCTSPRMSMSYNILWYNDITKHLFCESFDIGRIKLRTSEQICVVIKEDDDKLYRLNESTNKLSVVPKNKAFDYFVKASNYWHNIWK